LILQTRRAYTVMGIKMRACLGPRAIALSDKDLHQADRHFVAPV